MMHDRLRRSRPPPLTPHHHHQPGFTSHSRAPRPSPGSAYRLTLRRAGARGSAAGAGGPKTVPLLLKPPMRRRLPLLPK